MRNIGGELAWEAVASEIESPGHNQVFFSLNQSSEARPGRLVYSETII